MTDPQRRTAMIILTATTGYVRAAKGLVGRAIRQSLGIKKWHTDPHNVSYMTAAEMAGYAGSRELADPRFSMEVTDDELNQFYRDLVLMATNEGWDVPPVEIFHD